MNMESSNKVSAGDWSDCNSDRQPEIAIWPPKPEILIFPELRQMSSKFRRSNQHFTDSNQLGKSVSKCLRHPLTTLQN